jgi:WXG100 family type VII secretion target
MAGYKVQANYDDLGNAAGVFSKESDQTQQLTQQVKGVFDGLRGGGWIGKGAEAFFQEMEELVFPGLDRLTRALSDASSAAKRIADTFKQAEDEACGLFR